MRDILQKVLIVIPVLNEQGRIGNVISGLKNQGFVNVLVVDDGSEDGSAIEAMESGALVLQHIINRGAGAATATGLQFFQSSSMFECVVTIDGDGQHFVEDVKRMIQLHVKSNADITIGDRFLSGENKIPKLRIGYNKIADVVTSCLSFKKVNDSQSGFRVWSRKAIEKIKIEQDGFEFCSEVVIKAVQQNLKIINVPIRVRYSEELMMKGQGLVVGMKTFLNLLHHVLFKVK